MNCPSCLADNLPTAPLCFACGAPLDPALAGLAEGALFAGRYEILGPLGRGGMGMVYRAFDRELRETIAIKVLRPDMARESTGRVEQRFRSEIRLARRVRHRNVCSVYGDGEDRGLLFICMELVDGENLSRAARENGGLPQAEAWDAALQVAQGLEAIHDVGVVHRDLKTANLMRDRAGIVRVMDFGIAKQHGGAGEHGATVTATGTLMGTPEYMSPEQLRGEEVDFRSDLYSLAIVSYELFTGCLPFRGETPVATIVRQLQEPPALDAPGLPAPLLPVLQRALSKLPAERYGTAREMRRAIEAARRESLAGLSTRSATAAVARPPDDATRPLDSAVVRERPPVLRLALALLAVAALAAHLVSAGGPVPAPLPQAPHAASVSAASAHGAVLAPEPAGPQPAPGVAASSVPAATPRPLRPRSTATPAAAGPAATQPPARVAPPVDASRVYDEDEVDVRPRRVSGTRARYPEWGPRLSRGKRVSIIASYVVTEDGDVTDIRVEQGGNGLEAVLLEISRWKFEPGTKDGVPVKTRVQFRHTYVGG